MRWKAFPSVFALFILVLSACSSREPAPYEITYSDPPALEEALRVGFAMAPVDQVEPIEGGAESLAFFTNELYTALLVFTEGTEIIEPGVLLKRIQNGGEEFQDFARSFRRSRIRREKLSQSDTSRLFPHLAERFLFLAWVAEERTTDMRENVTEYQDIGNAMDIYDMTYRRYKGALTGELIDLVTGELVWKGVARYATAELYGDHHPDDLWISRSSACTALGQLFSLD